MTPVRTLVRRRLADSGRRLPHPVARDETGAVIILALVFLVAVSLVVLALLDWTGASLKASGAFSNERAVESAATNAVDLAISNTRSTYSTAMLNANGGDAPNAAGQAANPPAPCWGSNGFSDNTTDNIDVDVWCSMLWQPYSAVTRTITYSACVYPPVQAPPAPLGAWPQQLSQLSQTQLNYLSTSCAAAPLVQTVMQFDDYPTGNTPPATAPTPCSNTNTCGESMAQVSWQWRPTVPSVSSISPTGGFLSTFNGSNQTVGSPVTIFGSGFVPGMTVNFVYETGPGPISSPTNVNPPVPNEPMILSPNNAGQIVPATVIGLPNCTGPNNTVCQVQVTPPVVTQGPDYFVTVTTPGGTSPYIPTLNGIDYDDYAFSPVQPAITAFGTSSQTGGTVTGNTAFTLTGSSFYSTPNFPAQIWLCTTSTSPCTNGVQAKGVTIDTVGTPQLAVVPPPETITGISPSTTAGGKLYLQVQTIAGASTINASIFFNYAVQVPLITSISQPSGGPGSTFTVIGNNFLQNSTVQFCPDVNGTASCYPTGNGAIKAAATSQPTPVPGDPSQLQLTVTVPTTGLTPGSNYFPMVFLPAPYTNSQGYPPSQPYNEPSDIFQYT